MFFTEHGKKVYCKRAVYDKAKKRGVNVIVAHQPAYQHTISDDVRILLTKDEVDALQKWLDARKESQRMSAEKNALEIITSIATKATIALDADIHLALPEFDGSAALVALKKLTKALKKAGYALPKNERIEPRVERQTKFPDKIPDMTWSD